MQVDPGARAQRWLAAVAGVDVDETDAVVLTRAADEELSHA